MLLNFFLSNFRWFCVFIPEFLVFSLHGLFLPPWTPRPRVGLTFHRFIVQVRGSSQGSDSPLLISSFVLRLLPSIYGETHFERTLGAEFFLDRPTLAWLPVKSWVVEHQLPLA